MDSRNPFSKGLKRLNHRLAGGSHKRSRRPGSENDREGSKAHVEGSEAGQRGSSLYPEVGDVGSGPSWEGDDVGGDGVGQAGPPTSTPSILHSGEPNSMRTALFQLLPLTVIPGCIEILGIPAHVQEALIPDQSDLDTSDEWEVNPTDPSPAPSTSSILYNMESGGTTPLMLSQPLPVIVSSGNPDNPPILERVPEPAKSSTHLLDPGLASEGTSSRKSISVTTSAILHGVEESSGTYPPLKSVARHLCLVLDNCEVWSLPTYSTHDTHNYTSNQR